MDYEKLRAKLKEKAGTPAPAPEPEGDEPEGDEPEDDGMEQKLIDAVTAAIKSCFSAK